MAAVVAAALVADAAYNRAAAAGRADFEKAAAGRVASGLVALADLLLQRWG
jgi:hypothetical protein